MKDKDGEKTRFLERIEVFDSLLESDGWSNSVFNERGLVLDKIRSLDLSALEDLRQKAKCRRLKGGDENTNYFHNLVNLRKRKKYDSRAAL